jgi:hypothetical protein
MQQDEKEQVLEKKIVSNLPLSKQNSVKCSKQKNLKNRLQTNIEKQYTNILSILEKNCVDLGIRS